jgi:acyl-CoA thioester hydrolase
MHRTEIHVRWNELDPNAHVNHASYLTYLEHARISALEDVGWGMDVLADAGYQVVVVDLEIRFRRPAAAGETLVVETWVEEISGAASRWRQQIVRDGEVILEARVRAAATAPSGRPVRAPTELNDALAGLALP